MLGRTAVEQGQSVLDVVDAHHVTLVEVLPDARDAAEVLTMSAAAAESLTEVLASYAMASSAFVSLQAQLREAQEELAALRSRDAGAP